MSSSFNTVTVAGGTGNFGYHIVEAFLNDGSYKVKVLRRKSESENEKAKLLASKGAEIVYADYSQHDDLVKALKGTDVFISVMNGSDFYAIQYPFLVAAKEAHVKRFIPSEFGSMLRPGGHPFTDGKAKLREEIEKSGLEYTFFNNGLFQEPISFGWLGFDVKNKKATFYADGNTKLSSTCWSDIGKYTVESLKLPEARNAAIRVAGATLSLNEYLKIFEEATGSKWEVTVDKDVRHRFKNKIDPVPTILDDFRAVVLEHGEIKNPDNDKFSFKPRSITEIINGFVKQA